MLTNEKALYQVKLILDYLPKEEFNMIPQEEIEYIENNFEYDENITIDPDLPLDQQNIDEKTYEILDKIVKKAENNNFITDKQEIEKELEKIEKKIKEKSEIPESENIKLNDLVETLREENNKIPKAKELLTEYKEALKQKDIEIENLKKRNQELYTCIQGLPKIIRKMFIKNFDTKLLKD